MTKRPMWLFKVKVGESGRELVHRGNGRLLDRAETAVQYVHCIKTLVKGAVIQSAVRCRALMQAASAKGAQSIFSLTKAPTT